MNSNPTMGTPLGEAPPAQLDDRAVRQADQRLADEHKSSRMRVLDAIKQFATLSQLLRFAGAATMVASMSVFLLQGWDVGNDTSRYFLLLAQSLLLAGGGFALSYLLKENKGARVFFGLALVSVPVNFTILGALIYSLVQWDGGLGQYPGFANWVVVEPTSLMLTMLAATAVLVPLTAVSFGVIARRSARPLALGLLASCATLLLPIRGSFVIGLLIAATVFGLLWLVHRQVAKDPTLRTPEGMFARLLLFVPPAIVLVRSFLLYQPDALLAMMLSLTAFVALRQTSLPLSPRHWLRTSLELLSPLAAWMTAAFLFEGIDPAVANYWNLPVFCLTFAALTAEVGIRAGRLNGWYLNTAALVACGGLVTNLLLFAGLVNAFACLVLGAAVLLVSFTGQRRFTAICGGASVLAGAYYLLYQVIEWIDLGSWGALAVIGATAIIAGSLLDRHGAALKLRLGDWVRQARWRSPAKLDETR